MNLQTAKNKIKKSLRAYKFAKEMGYKSIVSPLSTFNKCFYKLSFYDANKLNEWYSKIRKDYENL